MNAQTERLFGYQRDELVGERPGVTVLFMSGYARGVLDPQGVVDAGVNLIQKPFSEAELLATLRRTIASATPHRAP